MQDISNTLKGKVAVVAGATRGAGRGIACMLGERGATVYCTGRSVRGSLASGAERTETIDETAEMVTAYGGHGIAVRTDHLEIDQVKALFAQVEKDQGRLDILVVDIWGGDPLTEWGKPFWELDLTKGFQMQRQAVNAHIITSRYGTPLMLQSEGGLIIEITDGDSYNYRGNLFYDLVKVSAMRLGYAMAEELKDTAITALAVTPGFLRSEAMLDGFGVTVDSWRDAIAQDPHFEFSETPYFVGRAVAALAADPNVSQKAGRTFSSWDLAKEYDFDDIDGNRPDWGTHFTEWLKENSSQTDEADS